MKKVIISFIILAIIPISIFWIVVQEGYDKQNKYILFIKKFIPSHISRSIRDTVFIIPKKINERKLNKLLIQKKQQGFDGKIVRKKITKSQNKKKVEYKEYFLPFDKLDTSIGYQAESGSLRAHYLEIVDDKVIAISGKGKTIFFSKNNLGKDQLNQNPLPNNISKILKKNNYKLIGIRSLFYNNSKIYISLLFKSSKGYSMNVYVADLSYDKLIFKLFFPTDNFTKDYNIHSAGRITKFKENNLILSTGAPKKTRENAQNIKSFEGKILSLNLDDKKTKVVSLGHRNAQGLFYDRDLDLIINTEHGPKGGDEINFNRVQENKKTPNYGWPISSYGIEYSGSDPFKKSHKKYGFIEPLKNFSPSIGRSEIIYVKKNQNEYLNNALIVSSLRASSIYVLQLDEKQTKIISEDRIYFPNQRIRDIAFDKDSNILIMMFEQIPSVGIILFE